MIRVHKGLPWLLPAVCVMCWGWGKEMEERVRMGAPLANYYCSLDRNVDNLDQGGHCGDGERQSDLEYVLEVGSTEITDEWSVR